jgi:hypothetical protein
MGDLPMGEGPIWELPMWELLIWLEDSALGEAVRGSGVWTYGILNLIHVLGIGTLFGSVLVLDLRLLGLWQSVGLGVISKPTVPLAMVGFVLAALSGASMVTTNATEYYGNPFIWLKFPAIVLGVLNVGVLQLLPGWKARMTRDPTRAERRTLAVAGGVSLLSWLGAVAGGRMLAYW